MPGGPPAPGSLRPCRERIPALVVGRLAFQTTPSRAFTSHTRSLRQQVLCA